MFTVTQPSLLKSTIFFCKNLQEIMGDHFKDFYVSVGTITCCICLLKSERVASSVSFNVIEMVLTSQLMTLNLTKFYTK